MSERASNADAQVVLASRLLPDGAKLVWLQDWVLDRKGQGCWLTDEQLGARLGMSGRTVEKHRLGLAAARLHERIPPGKSHSRGWRATLPAAYRPGAMDPDVVIRKRELLDLDLGPWPPEAPPPSGESAAIQRKKPRHSAGNLPPDSGAIPAIPGDVRSSSAFDSGSSLTLPAVQASEAKEVSTTAESKADDGEPMPRAIDQRPRDEVEEEGWRRLRQRHAQKQAGST